MIYWVAYVDKVMCRTQRSCIIIRPNYEGSNALALQFGWTPYLCMFFKQCETFSSKLVTKFSNETANVSENVSISSFSSLMYDV
uniref:Uncharacterized protein n=1 Tax=Romanomermis culicivorax TaxID=13658 RepID=A0A915KV98_ROMCU